MKPTFAAPKAFSGQSLQLRITLLTLAVVMLGFWTLIFYVGRNMHSDLEHMLSEQQRSVVALHAQEIDRTLTERIGLLNNVTKLITAEHFGNYRKLQALLESRPALPSSFNGGYFITDIHGTAIASYPDSAKRLGMNYMDREHVANALKGDKSTVGMPLMSKTMQKPVVPIAVPIHNERGKVVGSLVGVIDLAQRNFLENIMSAPYGRSGNFILISDPWRLVVLHNDRSRILSALPATGAHPLMDQFMQSDEATQVLVDPLGKEVLASIRKIPVAHWSMVISVPTKEAFKPIHNAFQGLVVFSLLVILMAGALVWWLLQVQLAPVHAAFSALREQTESNQPLQPLPQTSKDEIGMLIGGFNHLLEVLRQRESDLHANGQQLRALAHSLHEAQQISHLGNWTLDLVSNELHWSEEIFRLFELDPQQFEATYEAFLAAIHPDDRDMVNAAYAKSLESRSHYQIEHRLLLADGRIKWVQERCHSDFDANGKPLRSVGTVQDITERKLGETALGESRDLLMSIVETIPMRVFWKDQNLNYLGCNTAFAKDAGQTSPLDLVGKDDFQMGWAPEAELYRADDSAVMVSGRAKLFYDEPQTTPAGDVIWLRTSKIPLKNMRDEVVGVLGLYEDITDRKAAELQLRKLSLVAEQSPESVLITDLSGAIEYVNESFTRKTGYSRDEILGRNPRILHSGQNSRAVYAAMWQALQQGKTWSGELINRRKDGSNYVDWAVITPLRSPEGVVTHYVALQDDITDRKKDADELERYRHTLEDLVARRTEELNSARLQADRANQTKSEFLANMSHEIRTPMNGMIGMLDVLRTTQLDPEQHRMLDTVQKSSMSLLNILNDILDFSKIEAGKLEIEQVPTALREVGESVIHLIANGARSKGVEVQWSIAPELPQWIQSDPTRLRQILLNLVGNAVKFVAQNSGRVALQIEPGEMEDGRAAMQFKVVDNGIGMDAVVVSKLFQPFTQADASTLRKYGGTGLGLSITQRLVHLMQGTIHVQSTPGAGSEFLVTLPLLLAPAPALLSQPLAHPELPATAAEPEAARQAPSIEEARRAARLILLAEDNETNREVILEQLRLLGYAAEMAEDGEQALQMWREGSYAVLLTDCHMPRMDGFVLSETIRRSEPVGQHLPIIAITANAMQGEAERCRQHGMDDYLSKPLRLHELESMLAKWLPPKATPVVWDVKVLERMVGKQRDLQVRLLDKFLVNAQMQLSVLQTAGLNGDIDKLGEVAHTLKSSARVLGVMTLGDQCQALEASARAGNLEACIQVLQTMPAILADAGQRIRQYLSQ